MESIPEDDPLDSEYLLDDNYYGDENSGISDRSKRRTTARGPNFTDKEQRLLDKLVKIYGSQINTKCNKMTSIAIKNRAWEELTKDFNSYMGGEVHRTVAALKKRHENFRNNKKLKSRFKRVSEKTDNNSPNTDDEVDSNMPGNVGSENHESSTFVEASMKMAESDEEDGDDDPAMKDLIRVHISRDSQANEEIYELKNHIDEDVKKSSLLNISSSMTNDEQAINLDSDVVSQQNKYLLQEHRLRLNQMREKHELELLTMRRQMQEKHDLELRVIKLEHSERLKIMKQEHFKKMKMLELEESVGIINKI